MRKNFIDTPIFNALNRICDLVVINVLFIICSIPIITIGASATGALKACRGVALDDGKKPSRAFFSGFKENFKQATILWLITLVVAAALFYYYLIVRENFTGTVYTVLTVALVALVIILLGVLSYAFPLMTRYENSLRDHVRNALYLSASYIPRTLLMVAVNVLPLFLFATSVDLFSYTLIFWILIGMSGIFTLDSLLLKKVFAELEGESEKDKA